MATKRYKRRGSRKGRRKLLKDNFYKATVVSLLADPEGADTRLRRLWEEAADAAVGGGVPDRDLKRLVGKAQKDAAEINEFLDAHPDMLVKIEGQEWVIDTEFEA